MQRVQVKKEGKKRLWLIAAIAAAAALLWWSRALVWLAVKQIFLGFVTALAALPVMKRLEKRFHAGVSAALSIGALAAVLAAAVFLIVPALAAQGRQLASGLSGLWETAEALSQQARGWLIQHGFRVEDSLHAALMQRGQEWAGRAVPRVFAALSGLAGGISQWLLAPVFGFYFLRDRRVIGNWLVLLLPVGWREPSVRLLREIKRETAGYLRGQLLLGLAVGGLTALALLLCGVPSWLALGVLMGILEWIPYVGPLIGTVVIAAFALPGGLWRALWASGAALAVQQLEGSVLSPKFIGQTTRLHPAAVILCIMLGSAAAGVAGIVLSVPLLLCLRAVLRIAVMYVPREDENA